jgi:hypothetical protein
LAHKSPGKPHRVASWEVRSRGCTKSGHEPVKGVQLIENACTYERRFFIDQKNKKSKKTIVL